MRMSCIPAVRYTREAEQARATLKAALQADKRCEQAVAKEETAMKERSPFRAAKEAKEAAKPAKPASSGGFLSILSASMHAIPPPLLSCNK